MELTCICPLQRSVDRRPEMGHRTREKSCIQKPIFGLIFQPNLVPFSGTKFGSENGTNGGAYSANEGFGLAVFPFLEPNLVAKTGTRGSTKSSPREGKKSTAKVYAPVLRTRKGRTRARGEQKKQRLRKTALPSFLARFLHTSPMMRLDFVSTFGSRKYFQLILYHYY